MSIERIMGQSSDGSTTISPDLRRIRSEAMTRRWQDPVLRASRVKSISQAIKDKWKNQEYRKKASKASSVRMTAKWQDPKYKERLSLTHQLKWRDSKYRTNRASAGINQINRDLWEAARDQEIIPEILNQGLIDREELLILEKGFSTKRPKKTIPEELMDKFSIAVAKVA